MKQDTLSKAKAAKNDEFYTQYYDIEREVEAYLEYDANVFRDKTVLLPCDDPEWSNFTRYFAQNFQRLGLEKLISTSYAIESKKVKYPTQLSLFETESPQFDPAKTQTHGKIFVLDRDVTGDGRIDINDLQWNYLTGDGDFRSKEVTRLRDEADIIVTNPPFSLFREFLAWVLEADKNFLLIGNQNAITYKEVFPLIKANKIWLGVTMDSSNRWFQIPDNSIVFHKEENGKKYAFVANPVWFTNLEHGRRHQPLELMTMADNIKYSRHKEVRGHDYVHYDNYDAIEVPKVDAIPSDYDGMMGVPISFLRKYCPEQFEIVGITKTWARGAKKTYPEQVQVSSGKRQNVSKLNDGAAIEIYAPIEGTYYIVDDKFYTQVYARVLIRRIPPTATQTK